MAFSTPFQTGETDGNKELKLEKKVLRREIEALGVQHEKTTKEVKDIESAKRKLVDKRVELSKVNKKIAERQKKSDDLDKENDLKGRVLDTHTKTHSKRMRDLESEYSIKKESLEEEISKKKKQNLLLDQTFEKLAIKIKDRKKEIKELEEDIIGLDKKAELIDERSLVLKNINDEIYEKKKELEPLRQKVSDLRNKEKDKENQIEKSNEKLAEVKTELEKENNRFDKFKKECSSIMDKFNKKMEERTIALDKRDGLVSEKEDWIKGKETSLRKVKRELERFYNRKINHIII